MRRSEATMTARATGGPQKKTIAALCRKLLRVGLLGFGGPLVTLSLMKQAFVDELGWLSEREYLERMGICKLLPGPVSSLMALVLGRKFFGFWGSVASLVSYLLPAFLIILFWVLAGNNLVAQMNPDYAAALVWTFRLYIVAAILHASYHLLVDTWTSLKATTFHRLALFGGIMTVALICAHFRILEVETLGLSMVMGIILYKIFPEAFAAPTKLFSFTIFAVFALFFIASIIVFGTGYMLFPYLEHTLVAKGAMSEADFQTGLLLGNLSPGPVVIAATYYGWRLGGFWGSIAATVGVFGGPFVLINSIYGLLEKLRTRRIMQHLSICIVPAVVVILLYFNLDFFSQVPLTFTAVAAVAGFFAIFYFHASLLVQLATVVGIGMLKMYLR